MFESVNRRTNARTDGRTPARLVYYKLTFEPLAQVLKKFGGGGVGVGGFGLGGSGWM